MVGAQTTPLCTSIANCIAESHIRGVFTTEKISDDLRGIEKLENAAALDAAAAQVESKISHRYSQVVRFCYEYTEVVLT